MNHDKAKLVFPAFFKNFEMPDDATNEEIEVYRVCKYGVINREAFVGSYEEYNIIGDQSNINVPIDSNVPGHYGTSCYEKERDGKRFLSCCTKHEPAAILAKGITEKSCGLARRTPKEPGHKGKKSHVDWWIYENASPQNYFSKCE